MVNAMGSKSPTPVSSAAKKRVPEVPELSRAALSQKVKIAVVESDPLRFIGFRALFDSEPDMELFSASASDIATNQADLILLGSRGNQNLFDVMAGLKAQRPDLRILVTGAGADDEMILKALAAGAKGYVDEAASPNEFAMAIRIVNQGSVWAPRRVLSTFIERRPRRSRDLHRSRKGSVGASGRGAFQQGDRGSARHRRKNGEGARRQTHAQGGSAEPYCTFGPRHHPFIGREQVDEIIQIQRPHTHSSVL
jgi:CheY-like chemotaxis protein